MRRLLLFVVLAFVPCSSRAQSNVILLDGVRYKTPQAALSAAGPGGTVRVPPGIWPQGSTPLKITGVSFECERGAIITFSGLSSSIDAVTVQGWSGNRNYPLTVDGCTFITSASGGASGRDLVQVSGGDHLRLSNLVLLDPGRDTLHVEPACSFCWIENLMLDNIKSNTCGPGFPGCTGTVSASARLRDDLMFALGEKFSSSLANVYINEVTINKLNLRAHARYGEHYYANNNCSGCQIATHLYTDTHTDGAGRVPPSTPEVYFEKGASGGSNQIFAITFASGDNEDTVTFRTAPVFKASGPSVGQGLFLYSTGYSNFASLFDPALPAAFGNTVYDLAGNGTDIKTGVTQYWKDGSPSQAGGVGMWCPGGSPGNDLAICIYSSGTWSKRAAALADGGFAFYNTSGREVSQVDNGGGLTPGRSSVSGLPAASGNAGKFFVVTDSTTVSVEGQTCVGGSSNTALAFSNGSLWKCF